MRTSVEKAHAVMIRLACLIGRIQIMLVCRSLYELTCVQYRRLAWRIRLKLKSTRFITIYLGIKSSPTNVIHQIQAKYTLQIWFLLINVYYINTTINNYHFTCWIYIINMLAQICPIILSTRGVNRGHFVKIINHDVHCYLICFEYKYINGK